jgi:hypothetical protein
MAGEDSPPPAPVGKNHLSVPGVPAPAGPPMKTRQMIVATLKKIFLCIACTPAFALASRLRNLGKKRAAPKPGRLPEAAWETLTGASSKFLVDNQCNKINVYILFAQKKYKVNENFVMLGYYVSE